MFKFGFSSDDYADSDSNNDEQNEFERKWDECKELTSKDNTLLENILKGTPFETITLDDVQIKYLCSNAVLEILRNTQHSNKVSILTAERNHSDLLPAVYEGGLKIWECTYDLLNYLHDNRLNFENKKVLDLGCGAGIVGIYTLIKGSTCCFQDYNSDVIEYITVPSVSVNSKDYITKCKFYSGDWESFSNCLENSTEDKFDFIFTSETIYNRRNYYKLHMVFQKLLKKSGTIFLAAKSFYFGVGGGISLFEEYLDNSKIFKYSCSWKCADGLKREILKIEFNTP